MATIRNENDMIRKKLDTVNIQLQKVQEECWQLKHEANMYYKQMLADTAVIKQIKKDLDSIQDYSPSINKELKDVGKKSKIFY